MNEKSVIRQSFVVFVLIAVILLFVGVLFGSWNWLTGLVLGYLLSLVNFGLVMKICEHILALSSSVLLVIIMNVAKLLIYAFGFLLACLTPWFHLGGVFIGYLILKLVIYIAGYRYKGGEKIG